jgi:ribosome-associated protein
MPDPIVVSNTLTLPGADLEWAASRASGPGGQNVNKVASKVELRFDLEGTVALDPPVKDRLRALARTKIDADGRILIVSQLTRDQSKNLEDARAKLRELVAAALVVPKKRRPTKPSRRAKARRMDEKRRVGEKKVARRGGGDE